MSGPLAGIRILEVGHMLAGPYCAMLLADLGAEVIKIEPETGDIARCVGPHRIGPHNLYFASLNRNKKSVVLDLGSHQGQQSLHQLAREAHALIVNLRPEAIRNLGLTYEALKLINPRLVCVALTGYGLEGDSAQRPAYDYVIQAMSGLMMMTGEPGSPPVRTGYSVVDNTSGMMGALGLVAKIVEGRGGQVDVAMFDVLLSQLNYIAAAWLNAGERPQRPEQSAHPYVVPAQLFETADGWMVLFITHDKFWRRFCSQVGKPEWLTDERLATMQARSENREFALEIIAELLRTRTTAQWLAELEPLGLVVSGIATLEDALASTLVTERNAIASINVGGCDLRIIANPIRIFGYRERYAPPPQLGEHSEAILRSDGNAKLGT
ncbi:MAG: CoA-transferase family protein 48 [Gammaproteobacteria bacterium]|nr:CoA-transferase family protein 48 [Gammaproteobacteria bacterium]